MTEQDRLIYDEFTEGLTEFDDDYDSYVELNRKCEKERREIAINNASIHIQTFFIN